MKILVVGCQRRIHEQLDAVFDGRLVVVHCADDASGQQQLLRARRPYDWVVADIAPGTAHRIGAEPGCLTWLRPADYLAYFGVAPRQTVPAVVESTVMAADNVCLFEYHVPPACSV